MARLSFEEVERALEVRGRKPRRMPGGYILALCPSHDDRDHPSLAVYPRPDGTCWIQCFVGCGLKEILQALGLDHAGHTVPEPKKKKDRLEDGETPYGIIDVDGTLVAVHVRKDLPGGGKTFAWYSPDGTPGLNGRKVETLPLYLAHRIPTYDRTKPIVLVEGEKAADALRGRGYQVVATVCGASTIPTAEVLSVLQGFRTIIWADNDEPGRLHGLRLARRLRALGVEVWRVRIPAGKPPAWDAADADPTETETLIQNAEPWNVEPERLPGRIYTLRDLATLPARTSDPIIGGLLPEGVAILAGKPKRGKSWLALQTALAVSSGQLWLGKIAVTKPRPVLYAALEDSPQRVRDRLEQLRDVARPGEDLSFVFDLRPLPEALEDLAPWAREHPNGLLVVDTMAKILRPHRNADLYLSDYSMVQLLADFAAEHRISALLVYHVRKAASEDPLDVVQGTTGITAAVDTVWILRGSQTGDFCELFTVGRDIPEKTYALRFDPVCAWSILGLAEHVRLTGQKKELLDALKDFGGRATPSQLARALGLKGNHVRALLTKLAAEGFVRRDGEGIYLLQETTAWGEE